jgi:hypothetical protein
MSPRWKVNVFMSLWSTTSLGLIPNEFVSVISISLSFQSFPGNCLALTSFRNSISYSILGDGVCISTGWKHNKNSPVWKTPGPVLYSGVFVRVATISLSGEFFWVLF